MQPKIKPNKIKWVQVATALYLAGSVIKQLMKEEGSRSAEYSDIVSKYTKIATSLIDSIQSDHLLALMLEIPTDHKYSETDNETLTIWEIAIKYDLHEFLYFYRLKTIVRRMWREVEYLDPSVETQLNVSWMQDFNCLMEDPRYWFYSARGNYYLDAFFYVVYVFFVSLLALQRAYPYTSVSPFERVVWWFNAGYVIYEINEISFAGTKQYFRIASNYWDAIITLNWVVLGFIRVLYETPENVKF